MINPLKVELSYPNVLEFEQDIRSARIIAPAYSGLKGELTATLQYTYNTFYLENDKQTQDLFRAISLTEMEHFELLGKAIKSLGVDPVITQMPPFKFNPYTSQAVNYSTNIHKVLLDAITGELNAIADYETMLEKLTNQNVSALITRIILDERLHVVALKEQLEKISKHTY